MADVLEALKWFAVFEVVLFAGIGITWKAFPFLPARGIHFARPIGLLCLGFLTWQGSILGLVPNGQASWWIFAGVLSLFTVWVLFRNRKGVSSVIRANLGSLVIGEVLFIALFAGFAIFKSFDPAISGTEKPMEFMLLNASWQTVWAPPQDAWLSGNPVAYYYFGYWMFAGIANMSAVLPSYAFNLAVATVAGMAATSAFGLVFALLKFSGGRPKVTSNAIAAAGGIFGVVALLLVASFGGWWEAAANFGIGSQSFFNWLDIKGVTPSTSNPTLLPADFWWWWRISRVINTFDGSGVPLDTTIQEFPAFSFVLGDLHPHLISIPFLLIHFGIALNLWRSHGRWNLRWLYHNKASALFMGFSIGAAGFLNLPDLPFILVLLVATATLKNHFANPKHQPILTALRALIPIVILVLVGVLAFWAFYPPIRFFGRAAHVAVYRDNPLHNPFHALLHRLGSFPSHARAWGYPCVLGDPPFSLR